MKTVCIAALLVLILGGVGRAEPKGAKATVAVVPKSDEFTKLRMEVAARADFNPYWDVDDEREAVMAAVNEGDLAKVIALSKPWLERMPVDADVQLIRAQALKKTGDIAGAMHHFHCYYGLLDSIAASGDGKSVKTGYKVISVAEEYDLLDEMRAKVLEQTLETPTCDRMHVKLADGTETDVFFDVSISMGATVKMIKEKR